MFADPAGTPQNLNFSLCVIETSSFRFCVVYQGIIKTSQVFSNTSKIEGLRAPKAKKNVSRHFYSPMGHRNV